MQNVVEAPPTVTLESALESTEKDALNALAAASRLMSAIKAARSAARTGDLKALRKAQDAVADAVTRATEKAQELRDGWQLSESDEESLLESGAYKRELLEAAAQAGVNLFEQEGYLACYPSLVKIQPRDRAVHIDRKPYRQIRPSHLAAHLATIQKGSPKLNITQFLETLYHAYTLVHGESSGVAKLVDLYRCLTLLPSARQNYSQQEFARDIYLLDAAGSVTTRDGIGFRLHPGATGAKSRANLLIVVTRDGIERTYYGIEFLR